MNRKVISLILATALLISMAAASEIFTAKALAATSITITATTSTGTSITKSTTTIKLCTDSPVKLNATIIGGSSPQASSIKWQTTDPTTGTFSTPTITATSSIVTYTDTASGTVTITAVYAGDSSNAGSQNTISLKIYNIDFNHDGVVNFLDVIAFVQEYIAYQTSHSNYNSAYDLAGDGAIDFNSLVIFVGLYESYQGPV